MKGATQEIYIENDKFTNDLDHEVNSVDDMINKTLIMKTIQYELNRLLFNNPKVNIISNIGINFEMGKPNGEPRGMWHYTDVITLRSP